MVLGALRGRGLPLLWWIAAVLVPGETAATDSPGVFVGFWKTVPRKTKGCVACSVVLSAVDSAGKKNPPKFEGNPTQSSSVLTEICEIWQG